MGFDWLGRRHRGRFMGAWHWPDNTLMHFGLVTQVVPVVYLFLMWWGVDTSSAESDVI